MVLTYNEIGHILDHNGVALLKYTRLTTSLILIMDKYAVLDEDTRDALKTAPVQDNVKKSELMDHLRRGPVERFLNFCRALNEDKQGHVVTDGLGLSLADIYQQLGIPYHSSMTGASAEEGAAVGAVAMVKQEEQGPPIWSSEHDFGEDAMYLLDKANEDLLKKLTTAQTRLRQIIPADLVLPQLISLHVFVDEQVEDMKLKGPSARQMDELFAKLRSEEVWKTHAFFRALAIINKRQAIDRVLGRDAHKAYV